MPNTDPDHVKDAGNTKATAACQPDAAVSGAACHADGTLWLSNGQDWYQFGTGGTLLGSQAYPGDRGLPVYGTAIRGAEFTFTPQVVPEPGALLLFGTGLLVLARRVARERAR